MNKFHEVTAQLEQALNGISYENLDISDEVKEQVGARIEIVILLECNYLGPPHDSSLSFFIFHISLLVVSTFSYMPDTDCSSLDLKI